MKTRSLTLFLMLVGLSLALPAVGKVYKIINPDGSITYTDTPPAEHQTSETIDLPPINEQSSLPSTATTGNDDETDETFEFSGYEQLSIISPSNDATVTPGEQTVTVSGSLTPALQPEHKVQLYYDAKPYGAASSALSVTIDSLVRGSHILQLVVIDAQNKQLIKSRPITIHVKRGIRPAGGS